MDKTISHNEKYRIKEGKEKVSRSIWWMLPNVRGKTLEGAQTLPLQVDRILHEGNTISGHRQMVSYGSLDC